MTNTANLKYNARQDFIIYQSELQFDDSFYATATGSGRFGNNNTNVNSVKGYWLYCLCGGSFR